MPKNGISLPLGSSGPREERNEQVEKEEDLRKALEEERKKSEDYLNRLKYLQADFENFQRRTRNEMQAISESGVRQIVVELLTVLDELECALEVGRKMGVNQAMVEGVVLVRKKFFDILRKEGLQRIESLGTKFDPNKHDAAIQVKAEASKEGTILEEIRVGYTFRGQVIRPSLVKVAISESKKD